MAARPYDLLVVGDLNVDILVSGDVTPAFGQVEKVVDDLTVYGGGSASIFAAGAAKMGLRVLFSSVVGDDLFGQFMLRALQEAGVDPRFVTVDAGLKTGASLQLSRGLDRATLTYLGSIGAVSRAHVRDEWFGQARHVHVATPFLLSGLRDDLPDLLRQARAAGMSVSLDTNWDPQERWQVDDLLALTDVFLPNEQELLAISRQPDLERAIAALRKRLPVLAIKRGAQGATVVSGAQRIDVPPFDVHAIDSTGAGDSFDAGFLAGWLRGEPLERCALLGAACGALTVTQRGGFNGQPTWAQAQALVDGYASGFKTR